MTGNQYFELYTKIRAAKLNKKCKFLFLEENQPIFSDFFSRILIQILATKFKLVEFEHIRTRKWQNPKFWQIGHFWHFV